jgi:beta-lactamase regulating signal transducer with metallopeptidase domain
MLDSSTLLAMLAAVAVKALLLVAMGTVAALTLRRSSAACRHILWTAVLGGVCILALSTPFPSFWSLPFGVSVAMPRTTEPVTAARMPMTARAAEGTRGAVNPPAVDGVPEGHGRDRVADALVLLWIGGVGLLALRVVAGQTALRRIHARARVIEIGSARALLDKLAGQMRIPRWVRLIETDAVSMPATWGVLRPVIAIPIGAAAWPEDFHAAAIRHELAHVRRHDALTQMGADLCCALLWFHPGVWFAARRMRAERERACDDAVLSAGTADVGYAEMLLALAADASRASPGPLRTAIAMADVHDLEGRLRAILDRATSRTSPRPVMASVPAFALIAAVTMAGLDVWGASPLHAAVPDGVQDAASPTPGSAEILYGERVPFTAWQERWALTRPFRPRNEREEQAIARLMEATQHEKQHSMDLVRERALWALWVAHADQVVDPLVAQLTNADWRVRAYAAWSLCVVGAPEARDALVLRLRDPVWRVRSEAAYALVALADRRTFDDMLPLLADSAWQVRLPAVEYLGRIGGPAARVALEKRLSDPHVAVRTAAEAALEASPIR